jgi:CubicO group peptidase (beta-lactamase class C family)
MPATSVAIGGMTEVDEPPTLAEKRARDPTRTAESPQRPRNARSSPAPASIVIIFGGNREACRMRHEIIPSPVVRVRRRDLLAALLVTTAVSALRADDAQKVPDGQASEGSSVFPSATWEEYSGTSESGFTPDGVTSVMMMLRDLPTTSLMVVAGGKIAFKYGDVAEVSYLASVRKSILSMLFGNYVESGAIDLERTIGDLGIDDVGGLLPIEKSATIADLLTARSGVYHPAASPGSDTKDTPARGSQRPGSYFYYNNWDFNVLGAIFEKLTGKTVFAAFQSDLAGPLQLQDFDLSRQRMLGIEEQSRYPAYHFFLSARDMARLGLVMVRQGRWNGHKVVPQAWVQASTSVKVLSSGLTGSFKGRPLGYGYLWWLPEARSNTEDWARSFLAAGSYGQFILGLPQIDTVIVHRVAVTDSFAVAGNLGTDRSSHKGVSAVEFLKIADAVLSARKAGTP